MEMRHQQRAKASKKTSAYSKWKNHENFIQLRRITEDTAGLQFDLAGNINNLSNIVPLTVTNQIFQSM